MSIPKPLRDLLIQKSDFYQQPRFVESDPIAVPHRFTRKQDIEIAGFLTALIAWGTRLSIIRSANRILEAMDNAPYDFISHHRIKDRKRFLHLGHRTFLPADLLFILDFLQGHYRQSDTLEEAFLQSSSTLMRDRLSAFHTYVFSFEHLARTRKHIPNPATGSACKRLNMFLRWMVRKPDGGVDFGLWSNLRTADLICPLDTHVSRVAYRLQLIPQAVSNWKMAECLTARLREIDPEDPCRFDFALFGLGVEERIR